MYSVENPVGDTFFNESISLGTKPEAFSTDIVVAVGGYVPAGNAADDVNVVEFATYNCPPTALTVSFSNTAVDNVPRIFAFSNSANPLLVDDIDQPCKSGI